MLAHLRPAIVLLGLMIALTGIAYPLAITGVAQVVLRDPANGSLIERNGKAVGSEFVGQPFSDPKYFWSRASGTGPFPYNAGASSGTNQGPTNPALAEAVAGRIKALREADPANTAPVPVDLVTASGSGLDPHISPANAALQVPRISRSRGLSADVVRSLVTRHTRGRQFGILGEPRVAVLLLNLELDRTAPPSISASPPSARPESR